MIKYISKKIINTFSKKNNPVDSSQNEWSPGSAKHNDNPIYEIREESTMISLEIDIQNEENENLNVDVQQCNLISLALNAAFSQFYFSLEPRILSLSIGLWTLSLSLISPSIQILRMAKGC